MIFLCYYDIIYMKIIWLTGTNGAGKWTVVEYLINKGFVHYSVSGLLKEVIQEKGLPVNRDTMIEVSNALRKQFWSWYLVEELYKRAEKLGKDCIIESIRTIGEINALQKQKYFSLWAVNADQKIRYERITLRGSEKDHVSFEIFKEQEHIESANREAYKHNITACIQQADYVLNNDGDIASLHQQIEEILKKSL